MRQLFENSADIADAKHRRAKRQFFNSLTSKKEPRMNEAKSKPTAIAESIEPKPTKPTSPITFGELASLIGVGVRELCEWAERGLLPNPQEKTSHPHHWRWDRDAMKRWIDSMKAGLAKAQKSRL